MSEDFLGEPSPAVQKVTICEGCHQYRGCTKYRTMWLCVTRCWNKRKRLYQNKVVNGRKEQEREDEEDTGKVVHRHRKRPRAGKHSGAGANYRRALRQ